MLEKSMDSNSRFCSLYFIFSSFELFLFLCSSCDYFPDYLLKEDLVSDSGAFNDSFLDSKKEHDLDFKNVADLSSVIFFDDFEDGILDGWTVVGPTSPWVITTTTSNSGRRAVFASNTGTKQVSYLSLSFTPPKKNPIHFQYWSRLVEMGTVDEFIVEYYDGESWVVLEQLDKKKANDSTYSLKGFELPPTTSKIRFGCFCNKSTKWCSVDDVMIYSK